MGKFDTFKVGDKAQISHIITQKDIDRFVELTGDDNKLHTDKEYVSRTSFKKPIVHGMLGASFISTIIGTKLPGDGALWFAQNIEFLLPVRVGDKLTIIAEVVKKIDTGQIIELKTDIYNQHKQKVTTGTAKVKIMEQRAKEAEKKKMRRRKTALIIGATGGIGRATSLGLARDGFDIAIHYHTNEKMAATIEKEINRIGQKAIITKADIAEESDVKDMIEQVARKLGTIIVLVNCATIKIPNIKFQSLKWQDFQEHLNINIKGAFNLIKHILPIMEREKFGKIINITTQAIETITPEWLPYITAKSALNGFSKALAVELATKGIRVNAVSPGMTDTELIADIPEKVRLLTAAKTPLRRLAEPEDIAGAIRFLASEQSNFLTGETIRVNGGQVML